MCKVTGKGGEWESGSEVGSQESYPLKDGQTLQYGETDSWLPAHHPAHLAANELEYLSFDTGIDFVIAYLFGGIVFCKGKQVFVKGFAVYLCF